MKILSIANPTGGTGKSATALAIAVAAAEYGRNVLLVDLDERANLTFQLAIENPRFTLLEVAAGSVSLDLSVVRTAERFDFLPGAPRLTALLSAEKLAEKFATYDLVVIDTASSLSARLTIASEISDAVLYPTTNSLSSVRGVLLAKNIFKDSWQLGVLPVMTDLVTDVVKALSADFKILDPAIPLDENTLLAQIENKSLLNFAKTSPASDAYRDVTYFLLEELFGGKTNAAL